MWAMFPLENIQEHTKGEAAHYSCRSVECNSHVITLPGCDLHSQVLNNQVWEGSQWSSGLCYAQRSVHKLFPLHAHFITPRSGGTLILVFLHCCSFLFYICIKIYTGTIVTLQNLDTFVQLYYFLDIFDISSNEDEK